MAQPLIIFGAGKITSKPLPAGSVVIAADTEPHRLNVDQFSRLSACFRLESSSRP